MRDCILTRAQLSLVFLADRKVCAESDEKPGGDQEGEDGQHLNTGPEIKAAAASGERHFEVLTKNKRFDVNYRSAIYVGSQIELPISLRSNSKLN